MLYKKIIFKYIYDYCHTSNIRDLNQEPVRPMNLMDPWLKAYMGQVMKVHLSFYLVLLSFDSKTR